MCHTTTSTWPEGCSVTPGPDDPACDRTWTQRTRRPVTLTTCRSSATLHILTGKKDTQHSTQLEQKADNLTSFVTSASVTTSLQDETGIFKTLGI